MWEKSGILCKYTKLKIKVRLLYSLIKKNMVTYISTRTELVKGAIFESSEGFFEVIEISDKEVPVLEKIFKKKEELYCHVRCLVKWISAKELISLYPSTPTNIAYRQKFLKGKCHRQIAYPGINYTKKYEGTPIVTQLVDSFLTINKIEIY